MVDQLALGNCTLHIIVTLIYIDLYIEQDVSCSLAASTWQKSGMAVKGLHCSWLHHCCSMEESTPPAWHSPLWKWSDWTNLQQTFSKVTIDNSMLKNTICLAPACDSIQGVLSMMFYVFTRRSDSSITSRVGSLIFWLWFSEIRHRCCEENPMKRPPAADTLRNDEGWRWWHLHAGILGCKKNPRAVNALREMESFPLHTSCSLRLQPNGWL